ncbi:hypothetical protein NDU88_003562 [Pleurodeles waltl]|uniref:Uncharacterized protein n=1 Tax=Pleurodeles waltl TaxID=8319 RepID=A0AAV7V2T2_PLEWA|nr:hypothetical protein NDU88_003562 [Pleurodeles waltl]
MARTQGPLPLGNLEIRISADFSKETADRRRAFLSFRTQIRRLDLSHTLSTVPDPPQWIAVEKLLLSAKEGLGGPYRDDLPSVSSVNPILKATRVAWRRAHRLLGIHPLLHAQAPLWRKSGLRTGSELLDWPQWRRAGIHTISQILENDTLKSFLRLLEEFNLQPNQEWRYLQLKHCICQGTEAIRWGSRSSPVVAYLQQ